jgi:diguanylate cyclase (GGDEF)-like protein
MSAKKAKTFDDRLKLRDDDRPARRRNGNGHPWRILIVDDDEEVHVATEFACADVHILGRPLECLHARSAHEARNLLSATEDIAVVLLDVVMEAEDAGLKLVRIIREELGLTEVRIILRTGQPGYAPEVEVIRDYDINDYRTKGELTRTRLVSSLTTAVRSYDQIRTINYSRRGLEKIVRAASELFDKHALESMAEGVLMQMAGLLSLSPNGLVFAQRGCPLDGSDPNRLYVVGAVGRYADAMNRPLDALGDARIEQAIRKAMLKRQNIHAPDHSVLYLNSGDREEAVFMDSGKRLEPLDQQLLEVFAANISTGFANVYLFQRLNFLAYYDTLTGLSNRMRLHEQAKSIIEAANEQGRYVSLLLLDLDRFKEVNDTLGHHVGDALLAQIGPRLRTALANVPSLVTRLGGDEFAVLLNGLESVDEAVTWAECLRAALTQTFEVHGMALQIGASIGVARYPEHGEDSHALLRAADVAMYQAKCRNAGVMLYSQEFDAYTPERLAIITDLGQAVRGGQLMLHYQPKVDLRSDRIVGFEALVRWRHPRLGLLYPDAFVHLAEMSEVIQPFTHAVMDIALDNIRQLHELGHRYPVAINLSARNLMDSNGLAVLVESIERHGVSYSDIELELTETALMHDPESAGKLLDRIAALGVRLSVDDFGTGYSSLAHLRRLPLYALKIDRSFVRDMANNAQDATIVRSTIALAHNLGLKVTAEGVEDAATLAMLREMGCDEVQGYYLCEPLPLEELTPWLNKAVLWSVLSR